jgi:hypothetical protein
MNNNEIVKIVIKSSSGYFSDKRYDDKVTLTENTFSYEYKPKEEEPEIIPSIKWSYKTTSELFKSQFKRIAELTVWTLDNIDIDCFDAGSIEFIVTYADKTKKEKYYISSGDSFKDLFKEIKAICPSKEIPEALRTGEDYED